MTYCYLPVIICLGLIITVHKPPQRLPMSAVNPYLHRLYTNVADLVYAYVWQLSIRGRCGERIMYMNDFTGL